MFIFNFLGCYFETHWITSKGFVSNFSENIAEGSYDGPVGLTWYIPHHPVFHPRKPGKTRIVFDCSATFEGMSLNNYIHQGPNLASHIYNVLSKFREFPIAFTGDIQGMYNQVRVESKHRDCLRFLWFENNDINGLLFHQ